ncbi:hypothetical protein [Sphaerisporangium rufum]|uniref:hypothetical protein n=1 Tax=Sphaerisporangium rufum TaxID=1381558 RepID=UPI001EF24D55|nr:hypothetical protein [Sphaerisporangium rufum]
MDGIRILAMLPRQWRKDLKNVTGDIAIRVNAGAGVTSAQIRDQVTAILAGPEVSDWELVTCRTLAGGPADKEDLS